MAKKCLGLSVAFQQHNTSKCIARKIRLMHKLVGEQMVRSQNNSSIAKKALAREGENMWILARF